MENYDINEIMKFFPPVDNSTTNPYVESNNSYYFHNSQSPLKIPDKNTMYSVQIISDLQMLRRLLYSNITPDRFFYELDKLYMAWGPNGRNILNSKYLEKYYDLKRKLEKEKEIMKEGSSVSIDYELGNLEKYMKNISFKHKYKMKDIDLNTLKISNYGNYDKNFYKSSKAIGKKKAK